MVTVGSSPPVSVTSPFRMADDWPIPVAALTGVMLMVVLGTFEWASFKTIGRVPNADVLVIIVVTVVTVLEDLAIAVLIGVILSALIFAWNSAKHVIVKVVSKEVGCTIYGVEGLLYFGSVQDFQNQFTPAKDPDEVVLDCFETRVCDLSGLEAIHSLAKRYGNIGKKFRVRHLSPDCRRMLEKAGAMIPVEVLPDDPDYLVAKI